MEPTRVIGQPALALLAVCFLSLTLPAQTDESDGLLQDAIEKLACREFSRLQIRGHLQQGFTFNPDKPHDRQNFGRLFDDRANDYRFNQLTLTLEQVVHPERCLDWGFKAQLMLGSDARFIHAIGTLDNLTDATIQPDVVELYGTFHLRAGIDWDLKVGTFATLCGTETMDPTGNVLYSHSTIFNFGIPFKHTGFLLSAQLLHELALVGGVVTGINTGLEDNNDALSFHGGVIGKLFDDSLSFTLATHYGPENPDGLAGINADADRRFILDLALAWNVNERWTLMTDVNYGHDQARLGIGGEKPEWYGLAQYVVCKATDKLDLVLRGEIFRDDDGFAVVQFAQNDDFMDVQTGHLSGLDPRTVGGGATTYYALTFGVNYRPCENVLLQAEVRYDRADGSLTPFDDSSDSDQLTIAFATLFRF